MAYKKLFNPSRKTQPQIQPALGRVGDRAPASTYVYDDSIEIAINVALATGRPLLISGEPGTGKTTLAADVARRMKWRFYSQTVSSRTSARDLLWTFDAVQRLSDASAGGQAKPEAAYREPSSLWWAFDPQSARWRGRFEEELLAARELAGKARGAAFRAIEKQLVGEGMEPAQDLQRPIHDTKDGRRTSERCVVLLDEIDKADPDVPNDLLEPLGFFEFSAPECRAPIRAAAPPLVLITTNGERDLPRAFRRRCIFLELAFPEKAEELRAHLLRIAQSHFGSSLSALNELVLDRMLELREETRFARDKPSTAEFLDALSACRRLGIRPGTKDWGKLWEDVARATLSKRAPSSDAAPARSGGDRKKG